MGGAESVVRNTDKRSSRREHRPSFEAAIARFREAPFEAPAPQLDAPGASSVRVCVRKRPFFPHESQQGEFDVISCLSKRVVVHDARMRPDMRNMFINHFDFTFDDVFGDACDNDAVYEATARELVKSAACGGSGTVMMYGQTGSGKTFTMGAIYERTAADLFASLGEHQGGSSARVTACFVELLGDNCFDMLNGGAPVGLVTAADGSVHPHPCVEVKVEDAGELRALLNMASKLRATAATGVHDQSSRSHACFRLFVEVPGGSDHDTHCQGCLTLVDLAGSEHRLDSAEHNAERLKEGAKINASLAALKECIRATESNAKFVPFRRNLLTQLLRGCFNGAESHPTVIIATVSPSSKDTEHTLNTLRHACIMDGQGEAKAGQSAHLAGGVLTTEPLGEINVTKIARERQAAKKSGAQKSDDWGQPPPLHQAKQSNTAKRASIDRRCLQKLPPRLQNEVKEARRNVGGEQQRRRLSRVPSLAASTEGKDCAVVPAAPMDNDMIVPPDAELTSSKDDEEETVLVKALGVEATEETLDVMEIDAEVAELEAQLAALRAKKEILPVCIDTLAAKSDLKVVSGLGDDEATASPVASLSSAVTGGSCEEIDEGVGHTSGDTTDVRSSLCSAAQSLSEEPAAEAGEGFVQSSISTTTTARDIAEEQSGHWFRSREAAVGITAKGQSMPWFAERAYDLASFPRDASQGDDGGCADRDQSAASAETFIWQTFLEAVEPAHCGSQRCEPQTPVDTEESTRDASRDRRAMPREARPSNCLARSRQPSNPRVESSALRGSSRQGGAARMRSLTPSELSSTRKRPTRSPPPRRASVAAACQPERREVASGWASTLRRQTTEPSSPSRCRARSSSQPQRVVDEAGNARATAGSSGAHLPQEHTPSNAGAPASAMALERVALMPCHSSSSRSRARSSSQPQRAPVGSAEGADEGQPAAATATASFGGGRAGGRPSTPKALMPCQRVARAYRERESDASAARGATERSLSRRAPRSRIGETKVDEEVLMDSPIVQSEARSRERTRPLTPRGSSPFLRHPRSASRDEATMDEQMPSRPDGDDQRWSRPSTPREILSSHRLARSSSPQRRRLGSPMSSQNEATDQGQRQSVTSRDSDSPHRIARSHVPSQNEATVQGPKEPVTSREAVSPSRIAGFGIGALHEKTAEEDITPGATRAEACMEESGRRCNTEGTPPSSARHIEKPHLRNEATEEAETPSETDHLDQDWVRPSTPKELLSARRLARSPSPRARRGDARTSSQSDCIGQEESDKVTMETEVPSPSLRLARSLSRAAAGDAAHMELHSDSIEDESGALLVARAYFSPRLLARSSSRDSSGNNMQPSSGPGSAEQERTTPCAPRGCKTTFSPEMKGKVQTRLEPDGIDQEWEEWEQELSSSCFARSVWPTEATSSSSGVLYRGKDESSSAAHPDAGRQDWDRPSTPKELLSSRRLARSPSPRGTGGHEHKHAQPEDEDGPLKGPLLHAAQDLLREIMDSSFESSPGARHADDTSSQLEGATQTHVGGSFPVSAEGGASRARLDGEPRDRAGPSPRQPMPQHSEAEPLDWAEETASQSHPSAPAKAKPAESWDGLGGREKAKCLFSVFCSEGRTARAWRKNDLRLINSFVVPELFGGRAKIDWAHPSAALDELERLVRGAAADAARVMGPGSTCTAAVGHLPMTQAPKGHPQLRRNGSTASCTSRGIAVAERSADSDRKQRGSTAREDSFAGRRKSCPSVAQQPRLRKSGDEASKGCEGRLASKKGGVVESACTPTRSTALREACRKTAAVTPVGRAVRPRAAKSLSQPPRSRTAVPREASPETRKPGLPQAQAPAVARRYTAPASGLQRRQQRLATERATITEPVDLERRELNVASTEQGVKRWLTALRAEMLQDEYCFRI